MYLGRGLITEHKDQLGSTRYTYDSFGNVDTLTDKFGRVTNYDFDENNQPVLIATPDGFRREFNVYGEFSTEPLQMEVYSSRVPGTLVKQVSHSPCLSGGCSGSSGQTIVTSPQGSYIRTTTFTRSGQGASALNSASRKTTRFIPSPTSAGQAMLKPEALKEAFYTPIDTSNTSQSGSSEGCCGNNENCDKSGGGKGDTSQTKEGPNGDSAGDGNSSSGNGDANECLPVPCYEFKPEDYAYCQENSNPESHDPCRPQYFDTSRTKNGTFQHCQSIFAHELSPNNCGCWRH